MHCAVERCQGEEEDSPLGEEDLRELEVAMEEQGMADITADFLWISGMGSSSGKGTGKWFN